LNLKANGFGRWWQTITIEADHAIAPQIADRLKAHLTDHPEGSAKVTMVWQRLTSRRGDDEDVVRELFENLDEIAALSSWRIVWSQSDY
jgi:hypothetical protein